MFVKSQTLVLSSIFGVQFIAVYRYTDHYK